MTQEGRILWDIAQGKNEHTYVNELTFAGLPVSGALAVNGSKVAV